MNAVESPIRPVPAARRGVLLVAGLLAVGALAAYHNTFSAPFVLDDADAIVENPTIRQLWPLGRVLFPPGAGTNESGRPVANLSLAINHAISGDAVWSYHALSLVIHFLAACTLFGVVRRTLARPLLGPRFGAAALPLAAAVAGVWLLHPLQTAAVTYVSERTESLAGLFCLLTLYSFIRAVESPEKTRATAWRVVSWASCLLGMATKEVMVVAPLLVLLYDLTFVQGGIRDGAAAAWRLRRGYYAALASTWILLGFLVAGTHGRGGTAGFHSRVTPIVYLQTQCHAIVVYLKLCFWPRAQVFDYGLPVFPHLADVWPQAVLLVGLLSGSVIALWRRRAVGFAGIWFFITLAPSSSVMPIVSQTMGEHRMYLALAAVVTLMVLGLYSVLGRRSLVLWPVVAIGLGGMTFVRNETYGSALTLWRDTVAKAPHNARARYNLGIVYSEQHDYAHAAEQDEAALQLDDGWNAAEQAPAVHNKLGYDLALLGRWPEAVTHYDEALRLRPDYAPAQLNLARALVRLNRYPEAIRHYETALRLKPGEAATETEFSEALLHEGRAEEAVAHSRAALRLVPNWAPGYNNLGYALLQARQVDESIATYRKAVQLDPRYAAAWLGLGYGLITAARPGEAITPGREAVKLQPGFADAHNTLGIAFAQTGRTAEAIASFEEALRLEPGAADVHNNLGNALATVGRKAEAIAQYREALRLNPDYAPAHRNLGEELQHAGLAAEAAEHLAAAARLEAEDGPGASVRRPSEQNHR